MIAGEVPRDERVEAELSRIGAFGKVDPQTLELLRKQILERFTEQSGGKLVTLDDRSPSHAAADVKPEPILTESLRLRMLTEYPALNKLPPAQQENAMRTLLKKGFPADQ